MNYLTHFCQDVILRRRSCSDPRQLASEPRRNLTKEPWPSSGMRRLRCWWARFSPYSDPLWSNTDRLLVLLLPSILNAALIMVNTELKAAASWGATSLNHFVYWKTNYSMNYAIQFRSGNSSKSINFQTDLSNK